MKSYALALVCAAAICCAPQALAQEYFPVNGTVNEQHATIAFTNATVFTDFATRIDNATLLIKDNKVIACGTKVEVPADAHVEDLNGKFIYPSFIDLDSDYGMPKGNAKSKGWPSKPQYTSKKKGAYHWNQAIRPEMRAVEHFTANPKAAAELRKLGFGVVLSHQKDGIARGSATLVALLDKNDNKAVLVEDAATEFSFQKGSSTQNYPTSQMGSIALLRQLWLDADWYAAQEGATATDLSLEALNAQRELPQIFTVRDYLSALRADRIGDEFGFQYILRGKGDEYKRIEDIKATNAAWILPLNFPLAYDVEDPYTAELMTLEVLRHWEAAPHNPATLASNNIDFALTTSGLKTKSAFTKALQKTVRAGLADSLALKALTFTPATLLGREAEYGSLKAGMHANFFIASGNVFEPGSRIHENWVEGQQHIVNDYRIPDVRGTYDLNIGGTVSQLKVSGKPSKLAGSVISAGDTSKATVQQNKHLISLAFKSKKSTGYTQLSGKINFQSGSWDGQCQLPNGDWVEWNAIRKKAHEQKAKPAKPIPAPAPALYPNMAYGFDSLPKAHTVLIKNARVWTNGPNGILKETDVLIRGGKIEAVGSGLSAEGDLMTIDATGKQLTSGIIDEHSHIGISRGVNEGAHAASAEVSIASVVNSDDVNIYRHLAGGVTAAQLLHGSANPIGGQSALVKFRWGASPEAMKIADADGFIKFALGENVKHSNAGDSYKSRFPQTRMGVEQVYYDHFHRAREYHQQWQAWSGLKKKEQKGKTAPRRDLKLEALAEILNSERFITCHSYQQGEINMLMHVADSMGFRINTFTHILEGYKVANKMRDHGVAGSTFSDWWAYKFEVNDAIPHNAALMHEQGITVALNSDDAEMGRRLNQEAAKAVKYGNVSEEDAWKMVTLNPAKILHLDDRMGSIEPGKDADLVLWSANPLSIYAKAEMTFIDGIRYYDMARDAQLKQQMQADHKRLIAKMLEAKANGEPTQKPVLKTKKLYHCDTMDHE